MAATNSKIEIWNMALGNIGSDHTVASETELTKAAKRCNLYWDTCRRLVLRAHHWNFATKRVILSLDGTPPTGWGFQYTYPSDCVDARSLYRNLEFPGPPIKFEIAKNPTTAGKVIWTNQEDAELIYTVDVDDVSLFDDKFVEAVAYCLGQKITMPLKSDSALLGDMLRLKLLTFAEATEDDANEDFNDQDRDAPWIEARS